MLEEVEVLLQHVQQFGGGAEVRAVDPVLQPFVGERVERGRDVQRLDVIGDCQLPLLLNEVDGLAGDEDLERHVLAGEQRDEVHEDLEHFGPLLLLLAVLVFGDEELA